MHADAPETGLTERVAGRRSLGRNAPGFRVGVGVKRLALSRYAWLDAMQYSERKGNGHGRKHPLPIWMPGQARNEASACVIALGPELDPISGRTHQTAPGFLRHERREDARRHERRTRDEVGPDVVVDLLRRQLR